MRLASSAQTLVPSRAVCLIFMSVPPAACQVYSALCLCGDRDGTRQLPSVPWRAGGERTAGRVPSLLRNEAVRQPTIYAGTAGASSGAAKSSLAPPPGRWAGVDASPLSLGSTGAHSLAASDLIAVLSVVHRPGHRYSAGAAHLVASSTQTGLPHIKATSPVPTKPCFAWWHQTLPSNVLLRFPRASKPGRLIENGRHTRNVQQPDQTHHRGLHLWPLRLTLPLPDGATGRGSSAHKPRLRPDLPRGTSVPSR